MKINRMLTIPPQQLFIYMQYDKRKIEVFLKKN